MPSLGVSVETPAFHITPQGGPAEQVEPVEEEDESSAPFADLGLTRKRSTNDRNKAQGSNPETKHGLFAGNSPCALLVGHRRRRDIVRGQLNSTRPSIRNPGVVVSKTARSLSEVSNRSLGGATAVPKPAAFSVSVKVIPPRRQTQIARATDLAKPQCRIPALSSGSTWIESAFPARDQPC